MVLWWVFVRVLRSLTGTGPGATGSGTLTTIAFKAKNGGNSTLTLADTKLLDNQDPPQQIPHTTINGNVQVTGIKDIAVTNVMPLKTIVGQGYGMNINVTVENQGSFTETFNVTLCANTTAIETKEVTLESSKTATLTFTWNTTDYAKGNYTLRAYAEPVPGEKDIEDNTLINGTIYIGIPGDINGDKTVTLQDLVACAIAYGSQPSDPNWNPNADIDNDSRIGLTDLVIIAINYGIGF